MTAKINWQLGLALALSKVNKETRDSIIADMLAAMSNGGESDEHKALAAQIKAEIQPKLDELKGETKTTMSGKVTTDLTAEVVGSANINKVG